MSDIYDRYQKSDEHEHEYKFLTASMVAGEYWLRPLRVEIRNIRSESDPLSFLFFRHLEEEGGVGLGETRSKGIIAILVFYLLY